MRAMLLVHEISGNPVWVIVWNGLLAMVIPPYVFGLTCERAKLRAFDVRDLLSNISIFMSFYDPIIYSDTIINTHNAEIEVTNHTIVGSKIVSTNAIGTHTIIEVVDLNPIFRELDGTIY